jgi:cytochrome c5
MNPVRLAPLVIAAALAACGKQVPTPKTAAGPTPDTSSTSTAVDSQPSAGGTKLAAASDPDIGEKVYNATCSVCHAAGLLNAPKFGDKAAWAPRVAKGKDTLYSDALKGLNAMPPKGGNNTLKDEEVKAAVDFMLSKSS